MPGVTKPTRRTSRMRNLREEAASGLDRRRRMRGSAVGVSGSTSLPGSAETPTAPPEGLVDAADRVFATGCAAVPTSPAKTSHGDSHGAVGVADFVVASAFATTSTAPMGHLMQFRAVVVPELFFVSTFAWTPTSRTASGMKQEEGKGVVNPEPFWLPGFARMTTPLPWMEEQMGERRGCLGMRRRMRWGRACMRGQLKAGTRRITTIRAPTGHDFTFTQPATARTHGRPLTACDTDQRTHVNIAPHTHHGVTLLWMAMALLPPSHFIRHRLPPLRRVPRVAPRPTDAKRMSGRLRGFCPHAAPRSKAVQSNLPPKVNLVGISPMQPPIPTNSANSVSV